MIYIVSRTGKQHYSRRVYADGQVNTRCGKMMGYEYMTEDPHDNKAICQECRSIRDVK